ncbi:MAG TPA: cytochrome c [Bryobacteraceae bacterium]|nr:cytochrome c [Bryobacteraceae bacterium]
MRMLHGVVWFGFAALAGAQTFSGAVYPILRAKCQGCHQAGEIGPMAFTTYRDTRPWAKAIREAVLSRSMPPWHAEAGTGERFQNERTLTEGEIHTIAAWVDAGAPEGPATEYPPPLKSETGWRLGKPDLVVRVPSYRVAAKGEIPYTFLILPTRFTQDHWIRAAEFRIDKRAVVHHMNAFVRPPGSSYLEGLPRDQFVVPTLAQRRIGRPQEGVFERRELLIGYEPGYRPIPWREGQAKLIRAGSDIVLEMHFTANGHEQTDDSELGLYFAREAPRERVLSTQTQDMGIRIPPGAPAFSSTAEITFGKPVTLISLQPHMHLRGKAMRITAQFPDGHDETLLNVPHYSFNWQTTYFLKDPKRLPAGTTIRSVAVFDNSPNNPFNPDPAKTVTWGDQSWDEMHIGFMEIAFDARQDAEAIIDPAAKTRERRRFEETVRTSAR